jgi:hypothetical protein
MSNTTVIILVTIGVLVLAVIAFLIIRRQRYLRALRGRGWTFESRPVLDWVLDHHAPPFGLGFVRKVDEAISGTTANGVPFRVFEYAASEGGPQFDDRVASMRLVLDGGTAAGVPNRRQRDALLGRQARHAADWLLCRLRARVPQPRPVVRLEEPADHTPSVSPDVRDPGKWAELHTWECT